MQLLRQLLIWLYPTISLLTLSLFIKRVNKEGNIMFIKRVKINLKNELRISRDKVNGVSLIQVRVWELMENKYKPTQKCIVLSKSSLTELIQGLELSKYMESDIEGHS